MSNLSRTAFCGLLFAPYGTFAAAEAVAAQSRPLSVVLQPYVPLALAFAGAMLLLWVAPRLVPWRGRDIVDAPLAEMPLSARHGTRAELRRITTRAKQRMTRLRARIRRDRPDLLPEIAAYEAMLNHLLRMLAARPEGIAYVRPHLEGELATLENAAQKLSVVLGSASEEDAADSFRFALIEMTGKAASCLAGLRSMSTHATAPELGFLGGEPARRV